VPHLRLRPGGWYALSGILLLLVLLGYLLPHLSPFLLALFLSALIDAPVNHLERSGIPRRYAVLLVLVLLLVITVSISTVTAIHLLRDLTGLATQLPMLTSRLSQIAHGFVVRLQDVAAGFPIPLTDAVESLVQRLTLGLEALLHSGLVSLAALPTLLTNLTVSLLATYFMVRDGRVLARQAQAFLPETWQKRSACIKRDLFAGLVGFVRAEAFLMTITGMLTTIALALFHVPYAWLLGVAAGILDLVPLIGIGVVFFPLAWGYGWAGKHTLAAGLLAAWGVVVLVRQVCEPMLMHARIGLHPLTSLVTIYVGLRIWGFSGAFLAPLAVISLKVLWLGVFRPFLLGK
jgi:sporulation integral membrane protein YtvI